jgi:hypothetical protein
MPGWPARNGGGPLRLLIQVAHSRDAIERSLWGRAVLDSWRSKNMLRTGLTWLASRTIIVGVVILAATGAAVAAAAATSGAPGGAARGNGACVKLTVTAKPKLNTQAGSTETVLTTITNCSSTEVIRLKQQLSGQQPINGRFLLYRHETVQITQHVPYFCCGTLTVIDRAYSASGKLLATARASWTFA